MSQRLTQQLAEGDAVVRRLSRIASAARPSSEQREEAPPPAAPAPRTSSPAKAVAEAAHAFSERRRANGLAA
jgi:hypothetical protein